ncbi:hypothetical protein C8R44DRAFT_774832 [Mycena epipterygia]|nr:hypothetical protein C8R44DRAFT_774832 [Mycena epipterygia]
MTFALLVLYAFAVHAETVTLFGLRPNGYPMNAVSLSAGGVGADGATTYVEEIIQTVAVYGESPATAIITAPIPVQTLYATLVADASVYRYSKLPSTGVDGVEAFGVLETCTIDGNGGGTCVAQGWADGGETMTTTFSGSVTPFYTLTVGQTPTASRNGAFKIGARGAIGCVILSLLAFLL